MKTLLFSKFEKSNEEMNCKEDNEDILKVAYAQMGSLKEPPRRIVKSGLTLNCFKIRLQN